ncbi:GAF and ANTAR domain-containing protein [Amycolatopsis sp. CA-128772]|uniref:GAF and ANTAR domain-containing protein n=1 Tax=Amycolatopsis sp. CA-128772 TaxID=2073159 RepID=UPI000CD2E846|nr:GAF and ANTAR domain-containing protein [Amycolatopsis sp. CA-128772]
MAADNDDFAHRLDELGASIADLSGLFERAPDTEAVLSTVCAEAVRLVPEADMASITTLTGGEAATAVSTDDRAVLLDRVQYRSGEGPCLDAARTGGIVRVTITEAGGRWPEFVQEAKELGVGSFLAAPLTIEDGMRGALNLFGFGAHGYQQFDATTLRLYTVSVESALQADRRYQQAHSLAEHLNTAMRHRGVIEQAKGMLMLIHKIDEKAAMQRLITQSQNTNVKLRDVAADFVYRVITEQSSTQPGT